MENRCYLTVGTDDIDENLFREIKDYSLSSSIKPNGGLWLTRFDINLCKYNEWVDYILYHRHLLFYKYKGISPFLLPCSVVYLKDNCNIFNLSNRDDYIYLLQYFGKDDGLISYEFLSNCYDGIYIDLVSLDWDVKNLFSSFGVSSLILFNTDVIDYYYSGVVDIERFDYEDLYYNLFCSYDIRWDKEKKYVKKK